MTDNKLEDASSDKKYFMITPQLVWAICRSPYDYTLWDVIKMIAGENGECYLSTEDLAILSMMSTGKVSQCRKYLIEKGLLKGEIRRDPGYPQPVWHLQIPDIWKENVTWRQEFDSLADRIALKKEQKKSLHRVKASPGEEPPLPGETKKNQEENPIITPSDFGIGETDPLDGVPQATDGHQRAVDGGNGADPVKEVAIHLRYLCDGRSMKFPESAKGQAPYLKAAKDLLARTNATGDWQTLCAAIDDWSENPPEDDKWWRNKTKKPGYPVDHLVTHYGQFKENGDSKVRAAPTAPGPLPDFVTS
jgi:hypothetical protein